MRLLVSIGFVLLAALSACARPEDSSGPSSAREVSVAGRYELSTPGGTIGTIMSIVRCGSRIYVADTANRIHRIDLQSGGIESPIEDSTLMPLALAADCDRGRVWAISPKPRGQGLRAVAFDVEAGSAVKEFAIDRPCFPQSAVVSGDVLFIGGECIEGAVPDRDDWPTAAEYYSNRRIGVRVSLNSGEMRSGLIPFETSCDGAGACVGGSIAALGKGWVASLPVSPSIGVYSADGALIRKVPVGSDGATLRDGTRLPALASSEVRVRWSARNSLIHRVLVVSNRLVVAHYLHDVPSGWTMSSPVRPQFKARINVLNTDGTPQSADRSLPELPVGSDDEALYVVDYGPNGRQGAHEAVTVLRLTLPAS